MLIFGLGINVSAVSLSGETTMNVVAGLVVVSEPSCVVTAEMGEQLESIQTETKDTQVS